MAWRGPTQRNTGRGETRSSDVVVVPWLHDSDSEARPTCASLTSAGNGSRTSAATNFSRDLASGMPLASKVPWMSTLRHGKKHGSVQPHVRVQPEGSGLS